MLSGYQSALGGSPWYFQHRVLTGEIPSRIPSRGHHRSSWEEKEGTFAITVFS